MPQFLIDRWPNLPWGELPTGSITRRGEMVRRVMNEKWELVKQMIQPWMLSGEVVVTDATRSLKMQYGVRKILEAQLGLKFTVIKAPSQKTLPQPRESPARSQRRQLWHWDAIGLRQARRAGRIGTGRGVTVALLDSGVDGHHREFAGKSIRVVGVTPDGIMPEGSAEDALGHGTYIAGIIAGHSIGIAPDANLVCARVLNPDGTGDQMTILAGLNWVLDQAEVDIVVISLGFEGGASEWHSQISFLLEVNILPVIAVGNLGSGRVTSPGDTHGGLVVGWTARDGSVADASGSARISEKRRSYTLPDLVAPGVDVFSTIPDNRYARWSGATPATAIVAGVAALVREKHPTWSAVQVRDHILSLCRPLKAPEERQGHGLVRIEAAL